MNFNVLVKLGETLLSLFWQSCEVKKFVILLLEKYANSTDNDIDDAAVALVRAKLLVNCD